MGFGTKLSSLLKERGMTVTELAKLTGISSSTLYAIIRRDSDNINISALQKIAEALQIPVESLTKSSPDNKIGNIFNIFTGDFIDTNEEYMDIHFTTDEFTPEEIAEIIQFADFIKQRHLSAAHTPSSDK